jgi:hypothetical protein
VQPCESNLPAIILSVVPPTHLSHVGSATAFAQVNDVHDRNAYIIVAKDATPFCKSAHGATGLLINNASRLARVTNDA